MRKASPKAFYRLMSDVFVTSPATLRFCLQMATNILVGYRDFRDILEACFGAHSSQSK